MAYKNGFGAWAEGVELRGAVLAENATGVLGQRAALRDALVVGQTTNAGTRRPWQMTGVALYHDAMAVTRSTFVNFTRAGLPDWVGPQVAVRFVTTPSFAGAEVSGLRFRNADPLRMDHGDPDDPRVRSVLVRDLDGSFGRGPATYVGASPLVRGPGCVDDAAVQGWVCPAGGAIARTVVEDHGDASALGAVTLQADGLEPGPLEVEGARADGALLLGRRYRVATSRPLSDDVTIVLAGSEAGYVDYAVPWPHATAFVYDGWGRWQPLEEGVGLQALDAGGWWLDRANGVLHVRHELDGSGQWLQLELCRAQWCGATGPG